MTSAYKIEIPILLLDFASLQNVTAMADGGLTVLDGSRLRASINDLPCPNSAITGAQLLEIAESQASSSLFDLTLPGKLKSSALIRLNSDVQSFRSLELDQESAFSKLKEYFLALADELKDDPLVVSVLDGRALHVFFEDEDDIAMLAESLFTDLDTEDIGKLSKCEIQNALVRMGVEMGVPPFSESEALLTSILKKHEALGDEALGQAQFAKLLEAVLRDIAAALAEKPVVVIQDVKVINGSKLRKVLGDEKLLNDATERMFQFENGEDESRGSKGKIRVYLEKNGKELGLPPPEANEAVLMLYDQVFGGVDSEKKSRELEREEFGMCVKGILEELADELDKSPIFYDIES